MVLIHVPVIVCRFIIPGNARPVSRVQVQCPYPGDGPGEWPRHSLCGGTWTKVSVFPSLHIHKNKNHRVR